ncbi:MAG: hypothetical protein IJT59_01145 [Desulfovibrionaceae bacterium]|nr:hypothetical protein [Desulfovibrionaceae bacterium]
MENQDLKLKNLSKAYLTLLSSNQELKSQMTVLVEALQSLADRIVLESYEDQLLCGLIALFDKLNDSIIVDLPIGTQITCGKS